MSFEHAMLFTDLFTVLLSGDETEGQFGMFTSQAPRGQLIPAHTHHGTHEVFYIIEGSVRVYLQDRDGTKRSRLLAAGDFGFVPAGLVHAYQVHEPARILGVASGGFERFFQHMGQPTEHATPSNRLLSRISLGCKQPRRLTAWNSSPPSTGPIALHDRG